MSFDENLKKARKAKGLSQEELAQKLQLSRQAISKWESGEGYPNVEKLCLLAQCLSVSLDFLMKESGAEKLLQEKASEGIYIASFDGSALVKCQSVISSGRFKTGKAQPKYALIGVQSQTSFWGAERVVLGWYEEQESLLKELQQITAAMQRKDTFYEVQYAVKVKKHWWKMIIEDKAKE